MLTYPCRRSNLLTHPAGAETTLFDPELGHFHTLNASAALVWEACDGTRSSSEIAQTTELPHPYVVHALSAFADAGLLVDRSAVVLMNRRETLRQIAAAGILGATVIPAVASITGADSTAAASVVACWVLNCGGAGCCWLLIPPEDVSNQVDCDALNACNIGGGCYQWGPPPNSAPICG